MIRLFYITFCFFTIHSCAIGQTTDTTWFNKAWKPCEKSKAKYYRLVQYEEGYYIIRDYYLKGKLQMQASATSLEPEVLDGNCTYYHPNGKIESTGTYRLGKKVGTWYYYASWGDLIQKYNHSQYINKDSLRRADSIRMEKAKIPVSAGDRNFSIALRGKVAAFFIIEDTYFSTGTIGTEFMFKGRHSLGIDYTYFGWQYERDDSKDVGLYETYERRGYVYVDYKYRFLSHRIFDFYVNLYDKIGTYHMWHDGVAEGYNFWEKPWLSNKTDGTFNQVGAGLGIKCYIGSRFYFDASANGGKVYSKNNLFQYDEDLNLIDAQYNVKTEENTFYIRMNMGYKLFVRNKKKQDVFYEN